MANLQLFMPRYAKKRNKIICRKCAANLVKSRKTEDYKDYDKNTIHLPRHSSFMIMHTFADWGNARQNMAESLKITTVSTTKAHGLNWDKGESRDESKNTSVPYGAF